MWASGTLFFKVPSPIPFPKNPPLVIDSIALSDCKLYVPVSELKKDNNLFLMYWNFSIKKIKYDNTKINEKNEIVKKIIFIPEVKIKIDQLKKTNSVCPISGWIANNMATPKVVKNEIKYFRYIFENFWLLKIILIKIIKKGLTNSIGWNLGKKYKSIHLFEPFTSIPIIGTKIKKIKENKKIIIEYFNSFSWSIEERPKITNSPRIIKIRCLKKNE